MSGIINQALLKISLKKELDPYFFITVFRSDRFQSMITDNSHGGAMPNLVGMDVFRKVIIQCPPPNEQKAIAEVIRDIENQIANMSERLKQTKNLKQGMMQELLTGRTRLVS